jgi:hypothetical protein
MANSWAGSRHWKFARNTRAAAAAKASATATAEQEDNPKENNIAQEQAQESCTVVEGDEEGAEASAPKKRGGRKKVENIIDFTESFELDSKKFEFGKQDTVLIKEKDLPKEDVFQLPSDAKLEVLDLFRLNLQPKMLAFDSRLISLEQLKKLSKSVPGRRMGAPDCVWGEGIPARKLGLPKRRQSGFALGEGGLDAMDDVAEGEFGNNLYDDGEDGGLDEDGEMEGLGMGTYSEQGEEGRWEAHGEWGAEGGQTADEGLDVANMRGLLQVPRKVAKIRIGCETKAKLVNVRKLKKDIWASLGEHIDTENSEAMKGAENAPKSVDVGLENKDDSNISDKSKKRKSSEPKKDVVSFRDIVGSVAEQKVRYFASLCTRVRSSYQSPLQT